MDGHLKQFIHCEAPYQFLYFKGHIGFYSLLGDNFACEKSSVRILETQAGDKYPVSNISGNTCFMFYMHFALTSFKPSKPWDVDEQPKTPDHKSWLNSNCIHWV